MAEYGGLTASMATLAVFARSSNTLAGAATELVEWPGAHWERNVAHKHVPALVKKGMLRRTARGKVKSLDRYEITRKGDLHRRALLHSRAAGPAAVERDTAVAKIALCRSLEEVLDVIDSLHAEEELFERAYVEAHKRSTEARRARIREPERANDLCARLGDIGIAAEARLWDLTSKHLQRAREELETLRCELRGGA